VGKTSMVMCLLRELLGQDMSKAVLELNAAEEQQMPMVRERIKKFAESKVTLPKGRHKIVLLDEADSLQRSPQKALCRMMEIFAKTTRFVFICNIGSKIIEAVQSRCSILGLGLLDDVAISRRLEIVLAEEKMAKVDQDGLDMLVDVSEGDMRAALNNAQLVCADGAVTVERVLKVTQKPHPQTFRVILVAAVKGEIEKAVEEVQTLWDQGYSALEIVLMLFRVAKRFKADPKTLMRMLTEIGKTHMRIADDGVGTRLQIYGLLARLKMENI